MGFHTPPSSPPVGRRLDSPFIAADISATSNALESARHHAAGSTPMAQQWSDWASPHDAQPSQLEAECDAVALGTSAVDDTNALNTSLAPNSAGVRTTSSSSSRCTPVDPVFGRWSRFRIAQEPEFEGVLPDARRQPPGPTASTASSHFSSLLKASGCTKAELTAPNEISVGGTTRPPNTDGGAGGSAVDSTVRSLEFAGTPLLLV